MQRGADTLWQLGTLPVFMFWLAGVFLIGGAILRSGVLAEPDRRRAWLLRTRNLGLPIGFAAMAISIALGTASPRDGIDFADAVQVTLFLVASLVLALAYGATVLCALWGGAGPWLRRWLAPMGRMALSNYRLQSVIGTLLFYAYGFGLWGQVGRAAQAAGVVVVLVAQAWASRWWLARFRYGPAEWVWRCATYWRVVPLRAGA